MGKPFDLTAATKAYKGELERFYLNLSDWRKFKSRHALNWTKLSFRKQSQKQVPQDRGVYAFSVELTSSQLPAHGYILYIGETGERSAANLRVRFGQYLKQLENGGGRPRVLYMLKNWKEDLQFNFVALPNKAVNLKKIEQDLLSAVMPPINIADFTAEVTAVRKAAF